MAERKRSRSTRPTVRRASSSGSTGRRTAPKDTSAYRAVEGEQVARTRGEIDVRVADGQRLRDEIEARIEARMHSAPSHDVLR